MAVEIRVVEAGTDAFVMLLEAAQALHQGKYIIAESGHYEESLLIGAFDGERCVGFLRLFVQVIGCEEGRPPICRDGEPLREGFVEAFGVRPEFRRRGIGQEMQEHAIALCRAKGCYQIRSRSPITSTENYALKLKMGYAIHPSSDNDSYYFVKVLDNRN